MQLPLDRLSKDKTSERNLEIILTVALNKLCGYAFLHELVPVDFARHPYLFIPDRQTDFFKESSVIRMSKSILIMERRIHSSPLRRWIVQKVINTYRLIEIRPVILIIDLKVAESVDPEKSTALRENIRHQTLGNVLKDIIRKDQIHRIIGQASGRRIARSHILDAILSSKSININSIGNDKIANGKRQRIFERNEPTDCAVDDFRSNQRPQIDADQALKTEKTERKRRYQIPSGAELEIDVGLQSCGL